MAPRGAGSAYGHTTEILARELGSDEAVVGIDVGWKFVDESRKRCPQVRHTSFLPHVSTYKANESSSTPQLRFERLDVLEDQQFVIQLVDGCRATRSGSGSVPSAASAGGGSARAAPVTQPLRHPPKRSREAKAAPAAAPPVGIAELFTCRACSKVYSSLDYRSGAAGANAALAQHMRDIHGVSASASATNIPEVEVPGGVEKKVTSYVCTVCSVSKRLDEFSKNQRNGRKSEIQCKVCNSELRAARREAAMRQRGLLPPDPPQPQLQSDPHPQQKQQWQQPEPEPEPKPEPKMEPKPEPKPDPVSELQPQSHLQAQAQALQCSAESAIENDAKLAVPALADDIWVFVDIGGVRELAALVRHISLSDSLPHTKLRSPRCAGAVASVCDLTVGCIGGRGQVEAALSNRRGAFGR